MCRCPWVARRGFSPSIWAICKPEVAPVTTTPSLRPTVAAALIVRDEQGFLPGCLAALAGRVDEVVIVDTGSSDDTVALAKGAGARVLHHEWTGDFAAARNQGLNAATADWILYIDADERLRLPGPGRLGEWIDGRAVAGHVRFSPRQGYSRYREWRLFRRDDRIRFAGSFHETVIPAIRRVSAETGWPVVQTEVAIDHLGYDHPNPAKLTRNLTMLRALLDQDPTRVYCWHHLAETLMALDQREAALGVAQRGLDLAERSDDEEQQAAASLIRLLVARDMVARHQPVADYAAAALARYPADHALRLLLAEAALDEGRPEAAVNALVDLLSVNPDDLHTGRLAFDRRIFGEAAFLAASRVCSALDDRMGAARCVAMAAKDGDTLAKNWVIARLEGLRRPAVTIPQA